MKIEAAKVVVEKNTPFNREMILKTLPRLNYPVVVSANKELCANKNDVDEGSFVKLPETRPAEPDDKFLEALHHVLFNVHLVEGYLICPASGRRFPVKDSIPNMILHEDEL